MNTRKLAAALAVMGLALPGVAFATDGYFAHGYGMKALGRGGAAIAMTDDAFGGANNPGNMVWVGNRFDIGVQWFRPDREASRVGSAGGTGLFDGSASGNEDQNFFIPEVGFNYLVNPNLALGVSIYGNGGMNTKYPAGQLDSGLCMGGPPSGVRSANLLCGQGDLGVDLSQLIVAPTLSWKFHPKHSVGIAPLFAYQRFESYGLQPFAAISSAPANVTNRGHDSSTGWGVRIGWTGKITPTVTLGATWQSKISMGKFDSYSGLFAEQGGFDIPMNWGIGAAWQATSKLLLTADYEHIYYSQVKSVGNSSRVPGCMPTGPMGPGAGAACLGASADSIGFGWQDVSVFKLGAEYRINSAWLVRAGYNYSQNPIKPEDVTFNILAPGVVQNHLTLGFTWTLAGGSELTGMYFHAFNNSVSGPANNPYFPVGGTETISMSQNGLGIAWGMKF